MTARKRWDEMRSLIEAGWHVQEFVCSDPAHGPINWAEVKQAQHDGSRQIYGDAGKFMRGGEPG